MRPFKKINTAKIRITVQTTSFREKYTKKTYLYLLLIAFKKKAAWKIQLVTVLSSGKSVLAHQDRRFFTVKN